MRCGSPGFGFNFPRENEDDAEAKRRPAFAVLQEKLERVTRLELATSSLARRCSTTELHPQTAGFSGQQ
jgi:hypothetical protein